MSSNAAIAWQSFRLRPASLEAGKLATTACSGGMTPGSVELRQSSCSGKLQAHPKPLSCDQTFHFGDKSRKTALRCGLEASDAAARASWAAALLSIACSC